MNTLLAGPFVGEFGWELFHWQGFVRFKSQQYDKTIVIGRPGHKFLYEDFCSEYIEFDPECYNTDGHRCVGAKKANNIVNTTPHTFYFSGDFNVNTLGVHYHNKVIDTNNIFYKKQKFHQYESNSSDLEFDIIFHCRNKSTGSERNWDSGKWNELVRLLPLTLKIGCIGNEESLYLDGTTDLRGVDLETLCGIFCKSKLIVGPSSGPMHFASLCGMKHLVWTIERNIQRYRAGWNPFKSEAIIYTSGGWDPSPVEIKSIIEENL